MLQILEQLAGKSRWTIACFQDKLHISGRILSPIEAQAAGIASKAIMVKMYEVMLANQDDPKPDQTEEEAQAAMLAKLENLKSEDLINFGQMQDRVICQVVDKASEDGETFERLQLVMNEGQQNPGRNTLWVGILDQEDKNAIFEAAMLSVREATQEVGNF
jgi:hypothetical protein